MHKEKPEAILMLNSRCNAKCRHCYIPYKGERDPEEALETTKKLMDNGYKVKFSGSENLLNPEYLKCYLEAGQDYILSNGIILARKTDIFSRLKDHGIKMVILSHNFDKIESLDSVFGTIVGKAVENSITNGLKVRLSTLISASNFTNVLDYCRMAREMGVSGIRFYRYMRIGNASIDRKLVIGKEQQEIFFELIQEARGWYAERELEINLAAGFDPMPGSKGEALSKENRFCPAGETLFAITPDNKVYGCPFLIDEGMEIGRLIDYRIVVYKNEARRDSCIAFRRQASDGN